MRAVRLVPAALLAVVATVVLAGCGPGFDSMGQFFRSPLQGGICGLIYGVLNIIAMLEIIRSNRDLVSKVLWILALWFLPFVGVLAYYFFGRRG